MTSPCLPNLPALPLADSNGQPSGAQSAGTDAAAAFNNLLLALLGAVEANSPQAASADSKAQQSGAETGKDADQTKDEDDSQAQVAAPVVVTVPGQVVLPLPPPPDKCGGGTPQQAVAPETAPVSYSDTPEAPANAPVAATPPVAGAVSPQLAEAASEMQAVPEAVLGGTGVPREASQDAGQPVDGGEAEAATSTGQGTASKPPEQGETSQPRIDGAVPPVEGTLKRELAFALRLTSNPSPHPEVPGAEAAQAPNARPSVLHPAVAPTVVAADHPAEPGQKVPVEVANANAHGNPAAPALPAATANAETTGQSKTTSPGEARADAVAPPHASENPAVAASPAMPHSALAGKERDSQFEAPEDRHAGITPSRAVQPEAMAATPATPATVQTPTAVGTRERTPAAAPQAAPEAAPPREPPREHSVRELSLQVPARSADGGKPEQVALRVVERTGEIQVAVRTGDSRLASALRDGLPDLVSKLADRGYRTETLQPGLAGGADDRIARAGNAAADSTAGHGSHPDTDPNASGGWGRQGGQQQQQRRGQEPDPLQWLEALKRTRDVTRSTLS